MAKRIFVIDDEQGVREELEAWLEDLGYDVTTAGDGFEGLKRLRREIPHLIILDIIMPKMDGFEVLSRLKSHRHTASVPVIMLTAKQESSSILRAQQMKATDYVMKPFNTDDFLRVIQRHV